MKRTLTALSLLPLLALAGCGEDAKPIATEACLAFAVGFKSKGEAHDEAAARATALSRKAAQADMAYRSLANAVDDAVAEGREVKRLSAAASTGDLDGYLAALDPHIRALASANEAVSGECSPLGVDVGYR